MDKFQTIVSRAIPLPESDIDTDTIFPARFLLLMQKKGLGKHLFHERRHDAETAGSFPLDEEQFSGAEILITGSRFGIGSSREQAVWALADFGIRSIIAPSFGDIFFANCFKNGILPIIMEDSSHSLLMSAARELKTFAVDLEDQKITIASEQDFAFDTDLHRKSSLLLGLDEVDEILTHEGDDIRAFETRQWRSSPWLYLDDQNFDGFENIG